MGSLIFRNLRERSRAENAYKKAPNSRLSSTFISELLKDVQIYIFDFGYFCSILHNFFSCFPYQRFFSDWKRRKGTFGYHSKVSTKKNFENELSTNFLNFLTDHWKIWKWKICQPKKLQVFPSLWCSTKRNGQNLKRNWHEMSINSILTGKICYKRPKSSKIQMLKSYSSNCYTLVHTYIVFWLLCFYMIVIRLENTHTKYHLPRTWLFNYLKTYQFFQIWIINNRQNGLRKLDVRFRF